MTYLLPNEDWLKDEAPFHPHCLCTPHTQTLIRTPPRNVRPSSTLHDLQLFIFLSCALWRIMRPDAVLFPIKLHVQASQPEWPVLPVALFLPHPAQQILVEYINSTTLFQSYPKQVETLDELLQKQISCASKASTKEHWP